MLANSHMRVDDSNSLDWVATHLLSTNMTFTLLIQQQLFNYRTFRTAIGSMFDASSPTLSEFGQLTMTSLIESSMLFDLSPSFTDQKTVVSAILLRYKAGTGLPKPGLFLILFKADGSSDHTLTSDLLRSLKSYMTSEECSSYRRILWRELSSSFSIRFTGNSRKQSAELTVLPHGIA